MNPNDRKKERGTALTSSLVVVLMVAGLGAAMIQMQTGVSLRQRQSADNKRALYIAEAGLAESFLAITQGKSGAIGTATDPAGFDKGVYWVEATELTNNQMMLKSTGLCGQGRFSASVVVQRLASSIATLGVFGNQSLILKKSTIVDGYDSTLGTFESQATQVAPYGLTTQGGANVRGNGPITLEATSGTPLRPGGAVPVGTRVFGNAHPGPNQTVTIGTNAAVTGATTPAQDAAPLPQIEVPALPNAGDLTITALNILLNMTAKEASYNKVVVSTGATLKLSGPLILVVQELNIQSGGVLQIDSTAGPVKLYCTKRLTAASGSTISSVKRDPKKFALLVSAPDADFDNNGTIDPAVSIASNGEFFGVFYAPNAAVTYPASLRAYGTVAAKALTMADGARASFDKGFFNSRDTGALSLPTLMSWRVVEVPDEPITRSPMDPVAHLKRLGKTPLAPTDAHREKFITMQYTDAGGVVRTYTGRASLLDWNTVRRVVSMTWTPI